VLNTKSGRVKSKGGAAPGQETYPVAASTSSFQYTRPAPTAPASPTNRSFTDRSSTRPLPSSSSSDLDQSRLLDSSNLLDDSINSSQSLDLSHSFSRSSEAELDLLNNSTSALLPLSTSPPIDSSHPDPTTSSSLNSTRVHTHSPLDSPSTQIRNLQDALRSNEVKCQRLEKRLHEQKRKASSGLSEREQRHQATKVAELEAANSALSYQILYGEGPKDQEIRKLKEELEQVKMEGGRGEEGYKAEDGERKEGVKEEGREGWNDKASELITEWRSALTPIHDVVTSLSSIRSDLVTAVQSFNGQTVSLATLHQSLTSQQSTVMDAFLISQKEGEEEGRTVEKVMEGLNRLDERMAGLEQVKQQQPQQGGGGGAGVKEWSEEWRKEVAALTARLSDIHRDVSATAASVAAIEKRQNEREREREQKPPATHDSHPAPPPIPVSPAQLSSPPSPPPVHPHVANHLQSISSQVSQMRTLMFILLTLSVLLLAMRKA
jgi:hypothetical protein